MTQATEATWLKPDFVIHSSLGEMKAPYLSAQQAYSAGNYELAITLALLEGDHLTAARSRILTGGLQSGLVELDNLGTSDSETDFIRAFVLWTQGCSDKALSVLQSIDRGEWSAPALKLTRLIKSPNLRILVIHSSDSRAAAPLEPGPGFTITPLTKEDVLSGRIPDGNQIFDLILCVRAFPPELRDLINKFKGALVAVVSDFDMNIVQHTPILTASNCLLVDTSFEHHKLSQIYSKRIATFPGRQSVQKRPKCFRPEQCNYDLTFTGRAFSSYWPDRARFLFRIATVDEPELRIRIVDGFLPKQEYEQLLSTSRHILVPIRYGFSLKLGRTADALWQGSRIFSYGPIPPEDSAPELKEVVQLVNENNLENKICALLSTSAKQTSITPAILNEIYGDQASYDTRILKYIFFQLVLAGNGVEKVAAPGQIYYDTETWQAFENFRADPLNPSIRLKILTRFNLAEKEQPNRIMPAFNYARLLWMLEQKEKAVKIFEKLENFIPTGDLHLKTDDVLSHLINGFSEMMPYQEYYLAVIQDLKEGRQARSREVIMSTVKTYLGLHRAQVGDLGSSINYLEDALHRLPSNGPAARLLAKAKFGYGQPAEEVWRAIKSAVLIYPPYLTELLPFGLNSLEKLGQTMHAQDLARQWAYFITRVKWVTSGKHPIPDQTWQAATAYLATFPTSLRKVFENRRKLD